MHDFDEKSLDVGAYYISFKMGQMVNQSNMVEVKQQVSCYMQQDVEDINTGNIGG